jgi:hypothetical protein
MRRVRIVLTLTLVGIAPASAQPRDLKTDPYSLTPSKPTDRPGLTNFDTFVEGTDLWELRTHTNPIGQARERGPIPGFVQDSEFECSWPVMWTAPSSKRAHVGGHCTAPWTSSRGWQSPPHGRERGEQQ